MIRIAIQRCCTTPILIKQYETSTDSVLFTLGIKSIDISGLGCCGYPLKNFNLNAYVLSSGKNISLAEKEGLDILTFCNGCYLSLKQADYYLKNHKDIRNYTNSILSKEGLNYQGSAKIFHLLHYLYSVRDRIEESINSRFSGLKVATHYGCQVLRPRDVIDFTKHSPLYSSIDLWS